MDSIEILAVVESVSTEKGIEDSIILEQLKQQLHLHLKDIFMKMQCIVFRLIELQEEYKTHRHGCRR